MTRELVAVKIGTRLAVQTSTASTVIVRHVRRRWQIAIYARGAIVARRPPPGWAFTFRRAEPAPKWKPGVTRWRPPGPAYVLTLTVPPTAAIETRAHEPHGRHR